LLIEMKVEVIGEGKPEYAVIGCIHGDEPCGKKAIEKFLSSNLNVKKPVKFIIANEKALEQNKRYLDCDLNRVFPGNSESNLYEERLAAKLVEELEGLKVLDLHSTKSSNKVFTAVSDINKQKYELSKCAGVGKISFMPDREINSMDEYIDVITVECGLQQTEKAEKQCYQILTNFLSANNIIDREYTLSSPEIFKIFDTVEKPEYNFVAENFKKVEKDEVYAKNKDEVLKSEKSFYPVLMSTNGYKKILGRKAEKTSKSILQNKS